MRSFPISFELAGDPTLREEGALLAVIDLCNTCGFDIPADADGCPGCERAQAPSLAARQVAGLALPTRSVHALPATRPRRVHEVPPIGPARAARSALSYTTTLTLLTLAVAGLAWLAGQPRFVLQVPEGAAGLLDDVTIVSATATIAALAISLVAILGWCVRSAGRLVRRRVTRSGVG